MLDLYVAKMPEPVMRLLGASGSTAFWLLLAAAVFALAFFVASIARRQPQFQFVAEFAMAFFAVALLAAY
jgi:hypothetical protein